MAANFAEWEITVDNPLTGKLQAHGEDSAGNIEQRPHIVLVTASGAGQAPVGDAGGAVIIRSIRSGLWSEDKTWDGGKVPVAGARVQVRTGHTIIYDVKSDRVIRSSCRRFGCEARNRAGISPRPIPLATRDTCMSILLIAAATANGEPSSRNLASSD